MALISNSRLMVPDRRNCALGQGISTRNIKRLQLSLSSKRIVQSFFFGSSITGGIYLTVLRDDVIRALAGLFSNEEYILLLIEYGVPQHYQLDMRHFLMSLYPEDKWFEEETWKYTARSPVLTPIDRYLQRTKERRVRHQEHGRT